MDFHIAETQAGGGWQLDNDNDVSLWLEVGRVLTVQFDRLADRHDTGVLSAHVVAAELWTVHQRMYVRQTHAEIRHVLSCVKTQRETTTTVTKLTAALMEANGRMATSAP